MNTLLAPLPVRLSDKAQDAYADVYAQVAETAAQERLSLRDAAYVLGIRRVAEACRLKGWV